jgi:hypothetical protein
MRKGAECLPLTLLTSKILKVILPAMPKLSILTAINNNNYYYYCYSVGVYQCAGQQHKCQLYSKHKNTNTAQKQYKYTKNENYKQKVIIVTLTIRNESMNVITYKTL